MYIFALLTVLSGLLLSFSWVPISITPLIFIAFVPLLWIEEQIYLHPEKHRRFAVFGYSFLAFFIWNVITTYWILNSTIAGAFAFFLNSFLMAFAFHFYHISRKHYFKGSSHFLLLIIYWIGYEMFHLHWDLSFPWLNLGNVFASTPSWVQWYEYTGSFGGAIWVFAANFALFKWIKLVIAKEPKKKLSIQAAWIFAIILVPIFFSMYLYSNYKDKGEDVHIVVVQPNLDPYSEQYNINPVKATEQILIMADQKITEKTKLIVSPESMIQEYVWEHRLSESPSVLTIQNYLQDYPQTQMIAGLSSSRLLAPNEKLSPASRELYESSTQYYENHNLIAILSATSCNQKYYKSKLTPGVEIMPFVKYIKPIEKLALNMGGTIGSLGVDPIRKVFTTEDGLTKYSSIICYESIYGDFVTKFVRNGAEILCISTNDGWWGNTGGYKQHQAYASLRAIENRRSIARSANTGISSFINQRGDVLLHTFYWTPAVIDGTLKANKELTIYSRYGDYIGRVCAPLALVLLLLTFLYGYLMPKLNKKKRKITP